MPKIVDSLRKIFPRGTITADTVNKYSIKGMMLFLIRYLSVICLHPRIRDLTPGCGTYIPDERNADCDDKDLHALIIIGYTPKTVDKQNGPTLLLKNTFGEEWAENGFLNFSIKGIKKGATKILQYVTYVLVEKQQSPGVIM